MNSECKFYELDIAAQQEGEAIAAEIRATYSDEEWDALDEYTAKYGTEADNPTEKCAFCGHLVQGKGFPGEYVYYCSAPGNEHIIHVDFNESEII